MRKKRTKVILDTNILIAYLLSDTFNDLTDLIKNDIINIIISEDSVLEYYDIINRPKFKNKFDLIKLKYIDLYLWDNISFFNIKSNRNICRDEKDNYLLNLAIDSKADFLVTGDKDLLILENVEQTQIVTYREFIDIIKETK